MPLPWAVAFVQLALDPYLRAMGGGGGEGPAGA